MRQTGSLKPPASPDRNPALARAVYLSEGFYAVRLRPGVRRPAIAAFEVCTPPAPGYGAVEIISSSGSAPGRFGRANGRVVLRVPSGGGVIVLGGFGPDRGEADFPFEIALTTGRGIPGASTGERVPTSRDRAAIEAEIVLHIEGVGDRRFPASGWIGSRGGRRRIEAFGIRPLDALSPDDVEYKAFGLQGRETPWVSGGVLCGTRGRGLPLTGFAARIVPHLRDRFDIIYEGAFFASGDSGPMQNGAACLPSLPDDPLEAINLRIERHG